MEFEESPREILPRKNARGTKIMERDALRRISKAFYEKL